MNKKTVSILSSLGLLLTAAIWGFAFVIVKDSLDYVGPFYILAFRFTIAAIVLALIFIKKLLLTSKRNLVQGAITGFFLFMGYATQTIGCNYTTAGKNAFLTTIYVILIPFFSWLLYKKRPGLHIFAAAFLSITGIGLLALNPGEAQTVNIGDILTLVCGVFYAVHIIFTEKFNKEGIDPGLLTVLQFVFAALFSWISAPLFDGGFPLEAVHNGKIIVSMLYLGIFSTMIAFFLQNLCLKYVQSSLASLFLGFESVFGILFSTIFLHESLSARMITGCVLIFGAVVVAECWPSKSE